MGKKANRRQKANKNRQQPTQEPAARLNKRTKESCWTLGQEGVRKLTQITGASKPERKSVLDYEKNWERSLGETKRASRIAGTI